MIKVGRWRTLEFVGLQIEALSPNHAGRSRGCGQSAHELGADGRVVVGIGARQQTECDRQERIASEDRRPFVEGLVHGRLAPAQIVVVHGGQVVVHQRITVYALDGGRGGERGARTAPRTSLPIPGPERAASACPLPRRHGAWLRSGAAASPRLRGSQTTGQGDLRQVTQRFQVVGGIPCFPHISRMLHCRSGTCCCMPFFCPPAQAANGDCPLKGLNRERWGRRRQAGAARPRRCRHRQRPSAV